MNKQYRLQICFAKIYLPVVFFFTAILHAQAQEEGAGGTSIGLWGGVMGYQGDLQPSSFTFQQSKAFIGAYVRQPLFDRLSVKAGFNSGALYAADKENRDYLKIRNLSFYTRLTEGFLALEYELLPLAQRRFTPFAYGGLTYFHFNPYTFDSDSNKIYLQPLGTEGQGLSRYPDRKLYKRSQVALAFGGGLRFRVSDAVQVNIEMSQRKTFTDYLDDVSKSYADRDALLAVRGPKAVELAYRSDELPGGGVYPKEGEQRGTPTEKDWYYLTGISVELKLRGLARIGRGQNTGKRSASMMRCPKVN